MRWVFCSPHAHIWRLQQPAAGGSAGSAVPAGRQVGARPEPAGAAGAQFESARIRFFFRHTFRLQPTC